MRRAWLPLVLALVAPHGARGETIYASWIIYGSDAAPTMTRFDSETPWVQEDPFPPEAAVPYASLEFDPVTQQLWGFDYPECLITCPPPREPISIDPLTGDWSIAPMPGLFRTLLLGQDTDIDPVTREIRYFHWFGGVYLNYSYSIDRLVHRTDTPLSAPIHVMATAHRPPLPGTVGVETYVIGWLGSQRPDGETPWYHLARVGGPGGTPPADSGETTVIGPVDLEAERLWFDIAADGTAYLAVMMQADPTDNRLYRVDLATGSLELLGSIALPTTEPDYAFLSGIAVAPPGLGVGILEIPMLSPYGLALLAIALGLAALIGLNRCCE